jgi:flagellar FliJ protein
MEENEKNILAGLNHKLSSLMQELADLRGAYSERANEFEEKSKKGVTVQEIKTTHAVMKNIEYGMELKDKEIEEQTKLVRRQTAVVIKAVQDNKMLEKLKEKEYALYTKEEQKEQEKLIDEFVSYQRAVATKAE